MYRGPESSGRRPRVQTRSRCSFEVRAPARRARRTRRSRRRRSRTLGEPYHNGLPYAVVKEPSQHPGPPRPKRLGRATRRRCDRSAAMTSRHTMLYDRQGGCKPKITRKDYLFSPRSRTPSLETTGLEPATSSLQSWHSPIELRPRTEPPAAAATDGPRPGTGPLTRRSTGPGWIRTNDLTLIRGAL